MKNNKGYTLIENSFATVLFLKKLRLNKIAPIIKIPFNPSLILLFLICII